MTHLDDMPIKHLRKHILLNSIRRHSAQFCSVRWEVFTRAFWMTFVILNSSDLTPYPLHFLFVPNPGKTESALTEDWLCALNPLASFILAMVSEFSLRVETQRRPLQWIGDVQPPPACIIHIPALRMVLCVFLPRLHPSSDTLFARWNHCLTLKTPADDLSCQRFTW